MNAESEAKKADGLRESNVVHILNKTDLVHSETAYEFQGHHYDDTNVSFIVIDAPSGSGPKLHKHPYEEVFMVQEGSVTFTAGDGVVEATPGVARLRGVTKVVRMQSACADLVGPLFSVRRLGLGPSAWPHP